MDATLFFSPTSGGVRRYLLTKHEWFRRRAHVRHTLVVPGPRDRIGTDGIVEFASRRILAGYRIPLLLRRVRDLVEGLEPDVMEAADPYQVGWQVARLAETSGVPAVAFCHSDLVSLAEQRLGPAAGHTAAGYLRRLYEHFAIVLAPSRIVADRLRAAGIRHVQVLPLGVDPQVFSPARRDHTLRARIGLAANSRILTFAGRLAPEKNLPHLIEMIDQLGPPYHLLIVGGARARRPAANVTILPYQSDPRAVAALLAASDALVHAGLQETFGLIALEAMACAIPIACYGGGALAEIVDERTGVVAAAPHPASLAAAVADLFAQDPWQRGQAARRHVLAHYSWDAVFHRQLQIYGSLLGRRLSRERLDWTAARAQG